MAGYIPEESYDAIKCILKKCYGSTLNGHRIQLVTTPSTKADQPNKVLWAYSSWHIIYNPYFYKIIKND